jgi:hypothetical protein
VRECGVVPKPRAKALKAALQPKIVAPRNPRPVKYGLDVIAALTVCWTVLGMPAGKRLANAG